MTPSSIQPSNPLRGVLRLGLQSPGEFDVAARIEFLVLLLIPTYPMALDLAFLAAAALGHLCCVILALNVLHGIAIRERTRNVWIVLLFLWLAIVPVGAAGWLWARWSSTADWSIPVAAYAWTCALVGAIGLPIVTLARSLRRPPPGIEQTSEILDLAHSGGIENLAGQGLGGWLLRLPWNDSLKLRLVECAIELPGLDPSFGELSILQISDLHFTHGYQRAFFEMVFDIAARRPADLVVFTGDLVDQERVSEWIVPVFSRVSGRLGSFAILGNHDVEHNPELLFEELAKAGFVGLDATWRVVENGESKLAIAGTSAPWGAFPDTPAPKDAGLSILLSHSPDQLSRAGRLGVDLMFSGHNHGGQVRFPVVGPMLMPSIYSRRYDRGFFRLGKTLLYVSQGVGGKHPIRIGCLPEICRFVVRPAIPKAGNKAETHSSQMARHT